MKKKSRLRFFYRRPEVTSRPELQGYVIAAADAVRMYQLSLAQGWYHQSLPLCDRHRRIFKK